MARRGIVRPIGGTILLACGLLLVAALGCGGAEPAATQAPVVVRETVLVPATPQVIERTVVVAGTPQVVKELVKETVVVVQTATPGPSTPTPVPVKYVRGGEIRIGHTGDPDNLDTHATPQYVSWRVNELVYSGLVRHNENMELIPELAATWKYQTPTTLVLTLRDGLKFHDGSALTATDVKFSLERVALPDPNYVAANRSEMSSIERVDVIDSKTVQVNLKTPFVPLLGFLAVPPNYIVSKAFTQAHASEIKTVANGAGPFKMVRWQPGVKLETEAFKDYWEKGVPYVDKVTYFPMGDAVTRTTALLSGQVDLIIGPQSTDIPKIVTHKDLMLTPGTVWGSFRGWMMLIHKSPLDKVEVRQALNYATDRQQLINLAASGYAKPMGISLVDPSSPFYADPASYLKRDVAKAKELMAKAGLASGVKLIGATSQGDSLGRAVLPVLQQQWKEIGVDMEIQVVENAVYDKMTREGAFHFTSLSATDVLGDPDVLFRYNSKFQAVYNPFKDDEVDRLLDAGRAELNPVNRKEIYAQAQKRLDELAPSLMFMRINDQYAQNRQLKGFVFMPNRFLSMLRYSWLER